MLKCKSQVYLLTWHTQWFERECVRQGRSMGLDMFYSCSCEDQSPSAMGGDSDYTEFRWKYDSNHMMVNNRKILRLRSSVVFLIFDRSYFECRWYLQTERTRKGMIYLWRPDIMTLFCPATTTNLKLEHVDTYFSKSKQHPCTPSDVSDYIEEESSRVPQLQCGTSELEHAILATTIANLSFGILLGSALDSPLSSLNGIIDKGYSNQFWQDIRMVKLNHIYMKQPRQL